MQMNWARWQQPIGGNCNYNFRFQTFHCSVAPQSKTHNASTSWSQQLQQIYPGFFINYQQQFLSAYGQFGSGAPLFSHLFPNNNQNHTGYSNNNVKNSNNYSSNKTKTSVENEASKTVIILSDSSNNEETMEPKDFVTLTRFNLFAVSFKNVNAISENQVHEIFSSYGKVRRVKQTGDEHGLCFVNFEDEEVALKAAASVKNHPDIRLRPAKFNRSKHSSDNSSSQDNSNGNDSGNNFSNGNGKKNYSNENSENYSNGKSDDYSNENDGKNFSNEKNKNYSNENNLNGNRGNNYSDDNNKNDDFNEPDDKIFESTTDKSPAPLSNNLVADEMKTTQPAESTEVSNYDTDQKNTSTLQSYESPISTSEPAVTTNDIEKSDQHSTASSKSELQIPDLVAKISRISLAGSVESLNSIPAIIPIEKMAAEVLVANIQEGISLHAILQLFDKYHPLAATNILTFRPSNLRYCRVYFTSPRRAEDVEAEFNNCILMGKPLFVVRADHFIN